MAEALRLQRTGSSHALRLEGVTRSFGALQGDRRRRSSAWRPGERRAILGANGAGKTTLFNAITGDFPPTAGRIRLLRRGHHRAAAARAHPHAACGAPTSPRCCFATSRCATTSSSRCAACAAAASAFAAPARGARSTARDPGPARARASRRTSPTQLVASLSHGQQRQLEIGMALAGAPRLHPVRRAGGRACRRPSGASWSRCSRRCRRTWASC